MSLTAGNMTLFQTPVRLLMRQIKPSFSGVLGMALLHPNLTSAGVTNRCWRFVSLPRGTAEHLHPLSAARETQPVEGKHEGKGR